MLHVQGKQTNSLKNVSLHMQLLIFGIYRSHLKLHENCDGQGVNISSGGDDVADSKKVSAFLRKLRRFRSINASSRMEMLNRYSNLRIFTYDDVSLLVLPRW